MVAEDYHVRMRGLILGGAAVLLLGIALLFVPVSQRQRHGFDAGPLSVGITTRALNPHASSDALVIDLMCDPRSYQASTYSSDGFHPSDTGYAWIAAEVVAAATTSYRAPATSCSQMTLVQ